MNKSVLILAALALAGCCKQPEQPAERVRNADKVRENFVILETARNQASANALQNYAVSLGDGEYKVKFAIDPYQNADCPQGSGWADVKREVNPYVTGTVWCSTVSSVLGCRTPSKTISRPLSRCDYTIPIPLPDLTVPPKNKTAVETPR